MLQVQAEPAVMPVLQAEGRQAVFREPAGSVEVEQVEAEQVEAAQVVLPFAELQVLRPEQQVL